MMDRPHRCKQGLGTAEQKTHSSQCKDYRDKIWESHFPQKSGRQRLVNRLDPSLQGYRERQSKNWAEYFPKERPHLSFLSGLQHSGGAHTREFQNDNDDINTVGCRMTNGHSKGDRQHRLVSKKKSLLASGNWCDTARPIERSYRHETQDLTAILNLFFSCVSRPGRRNSLNATVGCTQKNLTRRAHTHIFFVRTPQRIICTYPVWAHHIGSR